MKCCFRRVLLGSWRRVCGVGALSGAWRCLYAQVDTFFNGLNEHQMQMANIAGAIGTKTTQQVYHYAEYVCDVMDRRVKASREEQLQKQAAALANAQQSGSAHDAGAAALQAAVAAFSVAPKEGTQLKEMLRSPAAHGTLAQVTRVLFGLMVCFMVCLIVCEFVSGGMVSRETRDRERVAMSLRVLGLGLEQGRAGADWVRGWGRGRC